MLISPITSNRLYQPTTFKSGKEEILSEGFKEFVSDALPIYKATRMVQKIGNNDAKGAVKQAVGTIDNIVCQPVKQSIATAVAAKGAAIGSLFGPPGAAAGALIGYVGTLWGWGKTRNTVVDSIMED